MNHSDDTPQDPLPPQGLTFTEALGIGFSFVWFHRNILLGVLAVYICYQVIQASSNHVSRNRQRDLTAERVVLDRQANSETPFNSELIIPDRPLVEPPQPISLPTNQPASKASSAFRRFLEESTPQQLLTRCESLAKDISNIPVEQGVAYIQRRQQICERLRMMELSAAQTLAVDVTELESLSQLNALNQQHSLGLPDCQSRLFEIAQTMATHPDESVAAKANLAIIAAKGVDVFVNQTNAELQQFADAYERHIDPVLAKPAEAAVVANLLQRIFALDQTNELLLTLCHDFSRRLQAHASPDLQRMGLGIAEVASFSRYDLATLLTRMQPATNETTRVDIRNFYVTLEEQANCRQEIFDLALAIIRTHITNEEYEDAAIAFDTMRRIQTSIPNREISVHVADKLNSFQTELQALADANATSL